MLPAMKGTAILSQETLGALLEAHASMAAWYYELWRAKSQGGEVRPPDEATRKAFLSRLAQDFPELASTAAQIGAPRMYVPPPAVAVAPPAMVAPPPMIAPPEPSGDGPTE